MFTAGRFVVQLLVVQMGLKVSSLKQVRRLTTRTPAPPKPLVLFEDLRPQLHLAMVVARHRFVAMFGVDCVAESVVIERMLRRNGFPSEFRLGLNLADRTDAHAWVETEGEPVNAAADIHQRFAAFDGALPGDGNNS